MLDSAPHRTQIGEWPRLSRRVAYVIDANGKCVAQFERPGVQGPRQSPNRAASSEGDILQVANVVKQDELRLDFGIRDSNQPDAEVRIPTAFRR